MLIIYRIRLNKERQHQIHCNVPRYVPRLYLILYVNCLILLIKMCVSSTSYYPILSHIEDDMDSDAGSIDARFLNRVFGTMPDINP